jgi:hypothetical protein
MPNVDLEVPAAEEFIGRCRDYEQRVKKDPYYKMYGVALYLVDRAWGYAAGMANGVSVLLVTWNWAFFNRYGRYDVDNLARFIDDNIDVLAVYRARDVRELTEADVAEIRALFTGFLNALRADTNDAAGNESPVAAGKALHVLCPAFFPLWDRKTALHYVGEYGDDAAGKYIAFCRATSYILRELCGEPDVELYVDGSKHTLVKLFDEYNYSKYTRGWPG